MLRVNSLGQIIRSPAFVASLQGKRVVFPDGLEIERPVFGVPVEEANEGSKGLPKVVLAYKTTDGGPRAPGIFFTGTVGKSAEGPIFTVTRSDDPENKRYSSSKSPTTPWREALKQAREDFPGQAEEVTRTVDAKGRLAISGIRQYGVHLSEVIAEIMTLPGAVEAFAQPSEEDAVDELVPPEEKKKDTLKGKAKASNKAIPVKLANAVPCSDCGLSGTPFCAATGKAHAVVCSQCGLATAFCPVSGAPHEHVLADEKVKRATPKGTGRRRTEGGTKGLKREDTSEDGVAVGPAIEGQEGVKESKVQPSRKRLRTSEGAAVKSAGGGRAVRARRLSTRGQGLEAQGGSNSTGAPKRQATLDELKTDDVSIVQPIQEKVCVYAPLRPPLSKVEQSKAAQLLSLKLQANKPWSLASPFLSLPLQPVPASREKSIAARRTKRGMPSEDDKEAAEAPTDHTSEGEQLMCHLESDPVTKSAPSAGGAPLLVHPLDLSHCASSAVEKRLTKFLLQYTSERTKLDALRTAGGGGSGASTQARRKAEGPEEIGVQQPSNNHAAAVMDLDAPAS